MAFYTKELMSWPLIPSILFLVFFYACTFDKPLNQNAQTFRERTLDDFMILTSKLTPVLANDIPVTMAGEIIKNFLLDMNGVGRRILGVGLLDTSGNYLTGYSIEDRVKGKLRENEYKGMKFTSFEGVERIVQSRNIVQAQLYLGDTKVLVIGFPLVDKDNLICIAYFSFNSKELVKEWKMSEQEFLRINFND